MFSIGGIWTLRMPSGSGYTWGSKQPKLTRPPNVPLFRALRSLLHGIWGVSKSSWGVLIDPVNIY